MLETYELEYPWIVWTYPRSDRTARILGRARYDGQCCICGKTKKVTLRLPRFRLPKAPEGERHPARQAFIDEHLHPGQRNPRDWKLPLRNPAAWPNGLPLDIFTSIAETARMELDERLSED